MRVYLKFFRLFLVLIVGVFFLVGSGGGGGDDKTTTTTPTEPITVLDSTTETISQNEIKSVLENNETTYTKSFTLDDKKTKVKLSFDLLENNVTNNINFNIEKLNYDEDAITAEIFRIKSNISLKNVDIEFSEITQNKLSKNMKLVSQNLKVIKKIDILGTTYVVSRNNFYKYIKDTKLNYYLNGSGYVFTMDVNQSIKNFYYGVGRPTHVNSDNLVFKKNTNFSLNLNKLDVIYEVSFGRNITFPSTSGFGASQTRFQEFKTYRIATDFLGLNKTYTVAEKKLGETRANTKDILNNFINKKTPETKTNTGTNIIDETVTHRITDFDKLMLDKNIIPTKTKWQNASYIPHGDDDRMPLVLVHGWNGDGGMRDPSKLLLWENSEFHYWHNFLAYYLSSEKLQKKYHIYLYRYTSYKHIPYSAKIFASLLKEVSASTTTDLGKGLNKNNGVTIMGHSMGGMVARAMIEDFNGLGANAEKLKKLITLDSPHRGSVGSMDTFLANFPKDLDTHGAMDLNYDNFDNNFNSTELEKLYTARRVKNGLSNYDTVYCQKLYPSKTLNECLAKTANPYMKYLNDSLANKNYRKEKYILYTAWNTHNKIDTSFGYLSTLFPNMNFSKNYLPKLNFINNGDISTATVFMGQSGYSAGGAESVGSSLLTTNNGKSSLNPKDTIFPTYSITSNNEFYYKDIFIKNVCIKYDYELCLEQKDSKVALITDSIGEDHPYKIPYRLFWDYDHETIFNGTAKKKDGTNRGAWDDYINSNSIFTTDTDKDTLFNSHREDYIKGAMKIRYGQEPTDVKNFNPLTYEPVFLVLEKDLLTSVTNGDIDEDKLPDEWEEANGLRWVNANDAKEDSDNDGLTNLQEYNNGTNSTDPQNEDSDGDGFKDGEEVTAGTNPNDILDYPYEKFSLTLDSTTSTNFNLSWTAPTGATKYKLCFSSIDEVSYESAQTCDSLIDGSFLSETTSTTLSFNGDSEGNLLQSKYDYYMRVVAYNDSNEVVGVSSEVTGKLKEENLDKKLTVSGTFSKNNDLIFIYNYNGTNCSLDFRDGTRTSLDSCTGKLTHSFKKEWVYGVELKSDNEIIDTVSVTIANSDNNWIGFVGSLNSYMENNEKTDDIIKNGRLYLAPSLSNESYYWTNYRYIKPSILSSVSGDNFVLEARIKNPSSEGGISCYDPSFRVIGKNGKQAWVTFMSAGCTYYSSIGAVDSYDSGGASSSVPTSDLSILGQDFSDWKTIKLEVKNQKVSAYYEGEKLYTKTYTGSVDKIYGIAQTFKGSGSMDWVKLYNGEGKLIYSENFN